jgi:hypothetical protein
LRRDLRRDFARAVGGRLEVLRLREPGEPAAEGLAVAFVVEAEEVGRAVLGGVASEGEGFQLGFGGRRVWEGDAETDGAGFDAGSDARLPFAGRAGQVFDGGGVGGAEDGDGGRAGGWAFDGEGGGIVAVGHDRGGVEDEVWRGETAAPDAAGDGYDGSCRHYGYRDRGGACAMGHAAMSIQRVWAVQVGFHLGHGGQGLGRRGTVGSEFFLPSNANFR